MVAQLAQLQGWRLSGDSGSECIAKSFAFADFCQTMTFVNALAWLAEAHQHHPELRVQYGACEVRYRTHDAAGITRLDFECAARADALLATLQTKAAQG